MGLLTGALQIGRSALLAYQSALQVAGNNIANAGSASYSRQTPVLTPITGVVLPEGFAPGGGVTLDALRRNVDESLQNRLRIGIGQQSQMLQEQQVLGRIESVLNELTDSDLSTLLQQFFNAWSSLQNQPHDTAARGIVLTAANSLVTEIQRQRAAILDMRTDLNKDLVSSAERASVLATDITALNVRITELEASQAGGANALRDQRDELLNQLAELMEVTVREQPDGSINVYVGNEMFIQGGYCRGLTTTEELVNGQPTVVVRFSDNNGPVSLGTGKMAGLVQARDTHALGQVAALNSFAAALIQEVNKVHSQGQGLQGITSVTGTYDVLDPAAELDDSNAGLDLTPRNGSFIITVRDQSTGTPVASVITVDLDGIGADETLASLAAKLDAVANISAAVTADNRLQITAASGYEFVFSEDTSYVLAALGINTFFTGSDAQDIAVNTVLTSNLNLLAGATSNNTGDGSNAAALAALATTSLNSLGGRSLTDYYNTVAANVAVKGAAATAALKAADAVVLSLQAQRESVSGVSLDEETISLLRFERAFQGAARFTSTVDQLIQEILAMVG